MVLMRSYSRGGGVNLILLISLMTFQNATVAGTQLTTKGILTSIKSFPFFAHIRVDQQTNGSPSICGGTLISSYYVLTAAQCVYEQTHGIYVYMGVSNLLQLSVDRLVQKRKVIAVKIHPQYKPNNGYDLALLRADKPFVTTVKVKCAKLPAQPMDYSNVRVSIIGWAATKSSDNPNKLHVGDSNVWEDNSQNCQSTSPNPICTKGLILGVPTQGNTGSPLIHKGMIIGVCSDETKMKKIVYENVNIYKEWIMKTSSTASVGEWNNLGFIVFILLSVSLEYD